jgi:hypothetical protein
MKPARNRTIVLSEPVYDALKERIMDRDLPPGGRVSIDASATPHGDGDGGSGEERARWPGQRSRGRRGRPRWHATALEEGER